MPKPRTKRAQSETVNAAPARTTENAAVLAGVNSLFGAFPSHPDHSHLDHADGAVAMPRPHRPPHPTAMTVIRRPAPHA